jgi:FtsP/CotA-like multicopper oxidase with cupredoxin domain
VCVERFEFGPIEGEGLIMRVNKIAGFAVFVAVFFAAAQVEPIDGLLAQICANICSSGAQDATLRPADARQSSAQAVAAPYVWADPTPVACPPQPTSYASLPSVTAPGDLSVSLSLGAGTGVVNKNPTLCFVHESLPAAPVIRIFRGNRLTVQVTNTLMNSGPLNTQNCTIQTYPGGLPNGKPCPTPETGNIALPGADGTFYPIQANLQHSADGSTNLHTHGFSEVSPQPCHDEVIQSTIYAANWRGPVAPLLPCQSAPNELTYSYDIPPDHPAGLYFYHTHRHGQVFPQTMMGAAGAIVIESEEEEKLRAAHGVSDDVMIVSDIPATFFTSSAPLLPQRAVLAQLNEHEHAPTAAADSTIDPRIDRDSEISCKTTGSPETGGAEFTRLLLNGAPVQETAAFPPPDNQVLVKTMKPGERQIWRIVNASAVAYISPQLVLSVNGKTQILPLVITALDGVPVHDDNGRRYFDIVDTTKNPLLMATANRVEILVHAPPPGGTLYLDSLQVTPGCAGNELPHRRLLRAVSAGANSSPAPYATASAYGVAKDDVASAQNDADLLPTEPETQYTHILDTPPSVRRVFAFTEYSHAVTVKKSQWIIGPPKTPTQISSISI